VALPTELLALPTPLPNTNAPRYLTNRYGLRMKEHYSRHRATEMASLSEGSR